MVVAWPFISEFLFSVPTSVTLIGDLRESNQDGRSADKHEKLENKIRRAGGREPGQR